MAQLTCLQIHNDYQIPGGETKTAKGIADLLEANGITVIRYYKTNEAFAGAGVVGKLQVGIRSLYNRETVKEIQAILDANRVDFALVHNAMPIISNSVYDVLLKNGIPVIKYIQNYNLLCLNGALDHGEHCKACQKNLLEGVKCKCYKGSMVYSMIRYLVKKAFDRKYLPGIAAFMPNSGFVGKQHIEYGLPVEKMHVMYNYIDADNPDGITAEDNDHSYYLYFGRISREKGVFTVVSAFEKMPDAQLIIMGSGELEEELKKRLAEDSSPNIRFIGSRSGEALNEVVRKAKCVIVSSEWDEPLPRTILESYAQGIPVIGTDRGGIPEMIAEGKTGFIYEGGDAEALRQAVKCFSAMSPEEYQAMRGACLRQQKEQYARESYLARFLACVEEIQNRHK